MSELCILDAMYNDGIDMFRPKAGFTLVELLIVIAIIGILAVVILTSLNDARQQGIDAKIKTEMDAITKRATIDQVSSGTFDTVCGSNGFATSSDILDLFTSINNLASSTAVCNSDTGAYAASVPVGNAHWCVDSTGVRREIGSALGSGVLICPSS